jgi:arylsulfatase A-like enzyme
MRNEPFLRRWPLNHRVMTKRPNLVIFNPDSWRGDALAHLGHPAVPTPNLDRMTREDGVSFRWAFCQNPVCTPSRCSFMTGWYTHVRGHRTMFHMLRPDEPCLLKILKDDGYFVWWGGKNDLVPAQHGFDAYCDVKYKAPPSPSRFRGEMPWRGDAAGDNYYSFFRGKSEIDPEKGYANDHDWEMVQGAIEFLRRPPTDKPFCIFLPLGFPHPPYHVEDPWFSAIDRAKVPPRTPSPRDWAGKPSIVRRISERNNLRGWSEDRWRELQAVYYGMCARTDHQFGLLMDALRRHGHYDRTSVMVFSDHGDFTGDFGLVEKTQNTFEDCLTRVPFLIKPPAGVAVKPRVSDALVELVDVPATVYDLAGITPAYTHFGRSLLPLLAGDTDEHRDAVFSEGGRLDGETHAMELASPSSSDPSGLYWPRCNLQQRIPEHTKAVMCRTREWKYVRRLYESDELYDLRSDPREQRNRIDDPACAGALAQLRERMLTYFVATGDVVPHELDHR